MEELFNFMSHYKPTFCMGYFNSPLYPSNKSKGIVDFTDSMKDLDEFINKNDLMDMEMCGVKLLGQIIGMGLTLSKSN